MLAALQQRDFPSKSSNQLSLRFIVLYNSEREQPEGLIRQEEKEEEEYQ
jgi:hypothetical protein